MATDTHNITITATDSENTSAVRTLTFTKETINMATTKTYVSLEKLALYDEKIKGVISAGDASALADAKSYADGLAVNYDPAGSATTAETNAKAYTDTKITEVNTAVAAAQAQADKGVADAATADGKAVAAQSAVDALNTYVGDIPEGYTESNVISYINKKAEETLASATGEGGESAATVKAALDAYKAENDPKVEINTQAIADITADYLTSADKTELQGDINAVDALVDTLIGDDTGKSARTIANEELAKQLIADGAAESLNELQEIAAWIQSHPGDASAMNQAIQDLEALVGTLPEGVTAITVVGYIQEVIAAEQTALASETEARTQADTALSDRLDAVEAQLSGGDGSVADMIATAKQEAIDAAATDATTKANTAETNAKGHADTLNTAMDTRVQALEAIDHDHANKALLDTYTQTETDLADAVAKKHSHTNLEVLEGVTAVKVAAWDAAEQNAKTYADGLNTTMSVRMDAVESWQGSWVEVSEQEINDLFA